MRAISLLAVVAAVAVAPAARADGSDDTGATHKGQIGLSARLALGYRAIAPHDGNKTYCGTTDVNETSGNASVCTAREPLALDLEAAWGVGQHVELTVELGLGLERDFGAAPGMAGPRELHLAPGARFFFGETAHSKLFVQPMLLADFTSYQTASGSRGTELGARGLEGFWLDLHRTYGLYIYVGETAGLTPWLVAGFEAGVGFQGRYP